MILGIGTDIVQIARVEKAAANPRFLERCFTDAEIAMFAAKKNNAQTIAANFAAKEAVVKALGTGFTNFTAKSIEILRNENGAPFVKFYGKALETADSLGVTHIHVSLSHDAGMAVAFAVCEKL